MALSNACQARLMDAKTIKKICQEKGLYSTPDLNEHMYLHFVGFQSIGPALLAYVNVRALFLEKNAIERIEHLEAMSQLSCLYLQQNCIETISGLDRNLALTTLNLEGNLIERVDGLSHLHSLHSLNLARNRLSDRFSIEHLLQCPSISQLDLSQNRLAGPDVVDVPGQMPNLACLYLKGNPFLADLRHYRKRVIGNIATLTFLDDRPVFDEERRLVKAWLQGGAEGELAERQRIQESKARSIDEIVGAQQRYAARLRAWKARQDQEGLDEDDTDAAEGRPLNITTENMKALKVSYRPWNGGGEELDDDCPELEPPPPI